MATAGNHQCHLYKSKIAMSKNRKIEQGDPPSSNTG